MSKTLLLFQMLLIFTMTAFSQSRVISGQIKDAAGNPVPFATITARTQNGETASGGASADANGKFKVTIRDARSLSISSAGFATKEVMLPEGNTLNIQLVNSEQVIEEVVVTALGIRRNKNLLPYAAQQINGDEVSQSRGNNFVSALSGKISGLEIRQGNGMGASTNVVIRGNKSLLNNNQAMFVVDGVPIDNSNTTNAATATGRVNDANARPVGGYDYGNAAADINPDDIESVTVLKGAAASALYGSRAANGVVMITTKKGKRGLGITVNSGVMFSKIDKSTFPSYQRGYGAGYSQAGYSDLASGSPNVGFWFKDAFKTGTKSLVVPTTEDASYGQKFDPNLMVYQWDAFDPTSPYYKQMRPWVALHNDPSTFYETGVSNNNSVLLNGGDEKAGFKLGYTRNEEKGVLPNSRLIKNLINFGTSYHVTDRLTASAAINFSQVNGKGRFGTGYNKFNVNQSFRQWYQMNVDMQELKDAYFRTNQNTTWNWADPTNGGALKAIYFDNPYFVRWQNFETDTRNRYFGNVSLNYKVNDWLNALARISLDSYDELHEERIAVGSVGIPAYSNYTHTFRELNYDLMLNADKDLGRNFNLKGVLGSNIRRTNNNSLFGTTNGGLVVPGLYALSNSTSPLNVLPTDEIAEKIAVDGYFAGFTLEYKAFLTLDGTGRIDRASTLPVDNNTYFYPSISGSFLFSKLLPDANWLNSGKIRANYAEVGNNAPFGSLRDSYFKPAAFGSATLFSLPDTKNNPALKPEKTKSKEIGLEMAFLKSRIGFDLSYYDAKSIDQIIPVSISTASGYTSKYVNAGTVQNRGIELSVFVTPVRTPDFSWSVNVNWTRNRNKVLALFESSSNLQINPLTLSGGVSINASLGKPYGTIQGKTWNLVDKDPAKRLVGADGFYSITATTNNVIGNINPDWTGGIYNTFRYKNISLGFLVDMKHGGDLFSLDLYYGFDTGIYPETAGLNDLGNPSRNTIANGGGLIVPGYTSDGKVNTKRVENTKSGYFGYEKNPAAQFVYDASYVKLRELNFTYSLPEKVVGRMAPFKGIDLSVVGRNLWIIQKNLPYADPEDNITSGNLQGYQSGSYPTARTLGFNVKLRF